MSKESVEFHVKSNDYFGTVATVISLVKQTIGVKKSQVVNTKILEQVGEDLLLLQKDYKIIKK